MLLSWLFEYLIYKSSPFTQQSVVGFTAYIICSPFVNDGLSIGSSVNGQAAYVR